jgi:hypothetical protein
MLVMVVVYSTSIKLILLDILIHKLQDENCNFNVDIIMANQNLRYQTDSVFHSNRRELGLYILGMMVLQDSTISIINDYCINHPSKKLY